MCFLYFFVCGLWLGSFPFLLDDYRSNVVSLHSYLLAVLCLWWLEISAKFLLATQHSVHWRVLRLGGKPYYILYTHCSDEDLCITTEATTYHRHYFTLSHQTPCRHLLTAGKSTTPQLCHFTHVSLAKKTDYLLSKGWAEIAVFTSREASGSWDTWLLWSRGIRRRGKIFFWLIKHWQTFEHAGYLFDGF